MRDKWVNNDSFSWLAAKPKNINFINQGIKTCKAIIKISKIKNKNDKIFCANNKVSFLSEFCSLPTKIGTKAELKAPSAKILRKKLGSLKAAKKTSERKPTPIYLAIKISRIKPKILDREIKNEIMKNDLNSRISNNLI